MLVLLLLLLLLLLEWSKEALLDAWMTNPQSTCEKAGVDLPTILSVDNIDTNNTNDEDDVFVQEKLVVECSICYCDCCNDIQIPCEHVFCTECWQQLVILIIINELYIIARAGWQYGEIFSSRDVSIGLTGGRDNT